MRLNCRKCGEDISAENININTLVAKCSSCDSVFSFREQVANKVSKPLLLRPKPDSVRETKGEKSLALSTKWFRWEYVWHTLILTLLVGPFLSAAIATAVVNGAWVEAITKPSFWFALVPAVYLLMGYTNRTVISADFKQITVQHKPIPWIGGKAIPSTEISQFYAVLGPDPHLNRYWNKSQYELHAILHNNKDVVVASKQKTAQQVLYMEGALEQFLGIEDQPVRGELYRQRK